MHSTVPSILRQRSSIAPAFILLMALAASVLGTSNSQAATVGSGRAASETRAVSDFDALSLKSSLSVEVRQSGKESVTIYADDNLLPMVETKVETGASGRTLVIGFRSGVSFFSKNDIKVVVDVIKLGALSTAGSGNVKVQGLKTPLLKISVVGSSDVQLNGLEAQTLEIRVAGSGNVQASGKAGQVKLNIAGSGDAGLGGLIADEVTASIAGSGDAQITANKLMHATVAGSGDLRWSGSATDVRASTMGSGTIKKR